ncbi:MAG: metallophosphoesterase [Rhodospirillales bacterium]|nr:metallophosphoesterase [Rhodospirillales bacterium]
MARMIPSGVPLRIVGDVHGDSRAFAAAAETDRFLVQLGDLVDDGPDTPGALRIMFRLLDEKRGLFLLGNHDFKLARALRGDKVRGEPTAHTLAVLPAGLRERTQAEITAAPAWINAGQAFFVHGGFHPYMLEQEPGPFPPGRPEDPLWARALFGQTTGKTSDSGKPERVLRWVEEIPQGMTIYVGHDQRSTNGRPYVRTGRKGGKAVFMDTGAGKGGHLSWVDIAPLS